MPASPARRCPTRCRSCRSPTTPPTPTPAPTTGTVTTGANGKANIPFTNKGNGTYTLQTYLNQNGTPGQQEDDLSGADLVFKAGDSSLRFVDAPSATSIAGTTDTYDAVLALGDGTPLAGRSVLFTFTKNATGNAVVAAQGAQPTGTTRNGDTTATGTTNADGVASVALADPASPDQAELNGDLDAQTATNTFGNAAEDAPNLDVDFVDGTPPARSTIVVSPIAQGKPGTATDGTVTVTSDADNNPATPNTPVEGLAVTLTVDQAAFFTNGTPPSGATLGGDAELENLGQSIVVVTDALGQADFQTSIGRDTGFDDDGKVTVAVTATSGAVSGTKNQVFDSSDPINGGELTLNMSPESVQDNPVDPTRVRNYAYFDIDATDQFDNAVGVDEFDLDVELDSNRADACLFSGADFADDGDLAVTKYDEGTLELTVTWTTGTTVYVADGADAGTELDPAAGPVEKVTDTADTDFYEIDFAASTFTITSTPEGTLPVGSAVTETVTVLDQEGNPVEDLAVSFLRAGPGDQQDGDPNSGNYTNSNGQAFYNFVGTEAGTAQVSAVVSEDFGSEPIRTLADSVTFGSGWDPDPEPTASPSRSSRSCSARTPARAPTG